MKIAAVTCLFAVGCANASTTDAKRLADAERRITALEERLASLTATPEPVAPVEPVESEDFDAIRNLVTKTGPNDYSVTQEALRLGRERGIFDARVVPHYLGASYAGIKLVGVRPGSFYRAIGIRSGDVITVVNGVALDTPSKALDFLEALFGGQKSKFVIEIERRGQPQTLTVTLEP